MTCTLVLPMGSFSLFNLLVGWRRVNEEDRNGEVGTSVGRKRRV